MEWSDEKIVKLIALYEQNSLLYDVKDNNYHNRIKKKIALNEIATELGTTGLYVSYSKLVHKL